MLSMLPLRLAVVPVYCSFIKSVFSPHSPQFTFKNFLMHFFCSITFNSVQIIHQNLIFIAETHVYTKPLTPNRRLLPSSTRSVYE